MQYSRTETRLTVKKFLWYNSFTFVFYFKIHRHRSRFHSRPFPFERNKLHVSIGNGKGPDETNYRESQKRKTVEEKGVDNMSKTTTIVIWREKVNKERCVRKLHPAVKEL